MSFHKLLIMPAAVGSFFFVLQIYSCSHIIDMFAYTESLSYRNLAHDNQFIFLKKLISSLVVLWQWYAFRVLFTCIQVKFMSLFLFYCLLLRSQTIRSMVQAYVTSWQVLPVPRQRTCCLVFRAPFDLDAQISIRAAQLRVHSRNLTVFPLVVLPKKKKIPLLLKKFEQCSKSMFWRSFFFCYLNCWA